MKKAVPRPFKFKVFNVDSACMKAAGNVIMLKEMEGTDSVPEDDSRDKSLTCGGGHRSSGGYKT